MTNISNDSLMYFVSDSSITLRVYSHFISESANMVISATDSTFSYEQ